MSIKKLFDASRKNTNYSDYKTDKTAFESVESSRNAAEITRKNETYLPPIDYSDPENFVKYGSAYYYYKGSVTRISEFYPYDGSGAEKNKFYNGMLDVEKYIFNNLYPRTTGFVHLSADGWGALSSTSADQYGLPATLEYITLKGGPLTSSGASLIARGPDPSSDKVHYSNVYDENIYQTAGLPNSYGKGTRLSNLRSNFDDGVTVEFWMKKGAFDTTKTAKEVIFDMWNNQTCSSIHYGRLSIELTGAATGSPFTVTAQSGTTSISVFASSIGESLTTGSLTSWSHYAFSFYNSGSNFITKLYVNGTLNDTNTYSGTIKELNSKNMMGRIGSLLTPPSASAAAVGSGKFSGSMDELRFWKATRTAQDVAQNYFVPVDGGTNTDVSNATLGLYYKFNEGITGESIHDSVVLDYGGRLSNGIWTGYGSNSRNTGSAIILSNAAISEYQDPIIRTMNPRFIALSSSLCATGSWYDLNNAASFRNYMPNWIIEEHEELGNENLNIISHIAGTYFDKIYHLSSQVPLLMQEHYTSASVTPIPFARHLPQSLGLYTPEIFIDGTVMEKLLNRDKDTLFQGQLEETKNLIYLNLYNNLTNIYKSKGTEKAIRNVLRCFYLDDSLFQLKTYAKNTTYELANNLQQHLGADARVNFNTTGNCKAIVYQKADGANAESIGYISGSNSGSVTNYQNPYGATIEADITFPRFTTGYGSVNRSFFSSSLFGLHTVNTASADSLSGVDTTFVTNNYANFEVHAIRDTPFSKNVYFRLSSSYYPYPLPYLTSSNFFEVYDNERWNLSVRIKPNRYPLAELVSGSASGSYDVIFRGASAELGSINRSFQVSGTVTYDVGTNFLKAPKRMYVGAKRTNLTGAVLNATDVLPSNLKYWTKYLGDKSLNMHVYDADNSGISGSIRNISALDPNNNGFDLLNSNTLALEWNFDNVTASNSGGNFVVTDNSSGSTLIRDNYSWLGNIVGYQHSGYGYGFTVSSSNVVNNLETNMYKLVDPENSVGSTMISILSEDDTVFDITETVPNYLFTFEKSMYNAISEEMLKFFAGVVDFNNLIGEPVNRYRSRYKNMEKLKEAFFRRVTNVTDVEKFVTYYKWFDDAISTIISQMLPASADFIEDTLNIVESHVLERNKYENKFPTLEFAGSDPETAIGGMVNVPRWEVAHFPVSASQWIESQDEADQAYNTFYWKNLAERDGAEDTSGNSTIDSQRETVKNVVASEPFLSRSLPVFSTPGGTQYTRNTYARRNHQRVFELKTTNPFGSGSSFKGGVNFNPAKNIAFTYNALRPDGPINTTGDVFVPENVLIGFSEDLVKLKDDSDPLANPNAKVRRYMRVQHGRDFQSGLGYSNVKSTIAFPFNLISSSVNSGYQKLVNSTVSGNVMITNLHNDVYGPLMEKPMQGHFTEFAVGGHQSRHVGLNHSSSTRALDNYRTRPEAWKILLDTCTHPSGAIGMVGPDYPWPEANDEGATPYPMTASQRAIYYRGMTAKRPVNIRNIHHTTGSPTKLGNYNENYEVVSTVGAYANPRAFVDNQPTLPSNLFQSTTTSSMTANTWLDSVTRFAGTRSLGRQLFVEPYSVEYLRGNLAGPNKSIIRSRFSSPGGIETATPAYTDFRSDSISAYNSWNNRNLSVIKPSQGPSGSWESFDGNLQTGSIRVNDILNKPYGLRSHLARHTARFGRDSLFQTGTSPGPDIATRLQAPGASYNQLPGFHKVHRNNITRIKKTDSIVITESTPLSNTKCVNYITDQSVSGTAMILSGTGTFGDQGAKLYQALTSSGFTYSGWLYFAEGASVRRFFNLGRTENGSHPGIAIAKTYSSSEHRIRVSMATRLNNSATSYTLGKWHCSGAAPGEWMHVAVAWTGAGGSLATVDPVIYINGTSQEITEDTTPLNYYPDTWRAAGSYKNFSEVQIVGDNMVILGGSHANTTYEFSGSMDEISIWNRVLNSAEITEIYNSGIPCDITASNTYDSSSSDLWEWVRMGDGSGTNAINSDNPGSLHASNKITGEINSFLFLPLCKSGSDNPMNINTSSPALLAGCISKVTGMSEVYTYTTSSVYDNFNIKHQIPRSTRQYAWISASLLSTNGLYGFLPSDFKISNSSGIIEPYDFITASSFGSFYNTSTSKRVFGSDTSGLSSFANHTEFLPVDFAGLNTMVVQDIDAATSMLGSSSAPVSDYKNPSFVGFLSSDGKAAMLNSLILNRQGPYGWPSWKQLRQESNRIVKRQRSQNQVVVNLDGNTTNVYEMPPVSLRGRTGIVNFDLAPTPTDSTIATFTPTFALKGTFTNEKIYFNTTDMNNQMGISLIDFTTPFEQAIAVAQGTAYTLNWVSYAENIFPSQRNEFLSRSTQRLGYDNKMWRIARDDRQTVGSALSNSFGIYYNTAEAAHLSQSCSPLDAPSDFLTRTRVPAFGGTANPVRTRQANVLSRGAGGELQNTYCSYLSGTGTQAYGKNVSAKKAETLFPGALYARKQQLTTPTSVVCSSGIKIPETGSQAFSNSPFRAASQRDMSMAGEAEWQAGAKAGIIRKSGPPSSATTTIMSKNIDTFMFSSSAPWYNGYSEFNADLKLKSKGFSTVPEFIVSNHVQDYLEAGTIDNGKTDMLEIVGTGIDSSTVTNGTASFYLDYSNSEFLQEFLRIKEETLMGAKEIKLVCSAAIKFVPYKGFYPADRTLQLSDRFRRDYAEGLQGSCKGGIVGGSSFATTETGDYLLQHSGGLTKPLLQPLFSPGIIYNSIKSGMAVDWPLVLNSKKFIKIPFGESGSAAYNNNPQNWAITCNSGAVGQLPLPDGSGTGDGTSDYELAYLAFNRTFFDQRLPFETAIYPEKHIRGLEFFDLDSHPSSSMIDTTSSWDGTAGPAYSLMARNFFGEVANFYLRDSKFTRLESQTVADDLEFSEGEVYMARLKLYRSMTGSRDYSFESGSYNYYSAQELAFTRNGAKGVKQKVDGSDVPGYVQYLTGTVYTLPQDPQKANYRENFTMYSRPSAFGPDIAGLGPAQYASASYYSASVGGTIYDSFTGHNPAYTPPYYDGQAWVDFIFRPRGNTKYNMSKIVAELTASYLRFDPGYISGSWRDSVSVDPTGPVYGSGQRTPLIFTNTDFEQGSSISLFARGSFAPYSGVNINRNSMQASASLNLFGIENVELIETDKFGNEAFTRNTTTGQKWVIEPKFETPMLNFNDTGVRPLTSSEISLPTFGSASVPRGMWHQFGIIEPNTDKGIFMEIGDLPDNWLKYNPLRINTGSVYNNFSPLPVQSKAGSGVKSLSSLLGFDASVNKARLGEIKESLTLKEAVIAIPYVVETIDRLTAAGTTEAYDRKQFITIPDYRFESALNAAVDSAAGDSLLSAGESIRRQIDLMQQYVLPQNLILFKIEN